MIAFYDYLNIAFYLTFVIGTGIHFTRASKKPPTIFVVAVWCRGGG